MKDSSQNGPDSVAHFERQELDELAAHYGFSFSGIRPLQGGWNNSSFLLTGPRGSYVLTLFQECGLQEAESLGALLRHLVESGFPAPPVLENHEGHFASPYRGRPLLIKKFIAGNIFDRLSSSQLRRAGAALAHLHAIAVPPSLPEGHVYERVLFPKINRRQSSFAHWLRERREQFEAARDPSLPSGCIHGDLFADNVLFSGEELIGVIDFEDACRHDLIFDLGMAVVGLACSEAKLEAHRAQALLAGYQEHRRLGEREREAFRASLMWAAASTAAWRYWRFRVEIPDPAFRDRYREMVALADHLWELPEREIEQCFRPREPQGRQL